MRAWIRVAASATLSLSVVVLLAACGKSPESTVEGFYWAISKGNITEARTYVSAPLVASLGDARFTAILGREAERFRACGGVKSVEVKLQGEGDVRTGTVRVAFSGKCPADSRPNVRVIKEDGKWKIGS